MRGASRTPRPGQRRAAPARPGRSAPPPRGESCRDPAAAGHRTYPTGPPRGAAAAPRAPRGSSQPSFAENAGIQLKRGVESILRRSGKVARPGTQRKSVTERGRP